jgi:hypothetical protein
LVKAHLSPYLILGSILGEKGILVLVLEPVPKSDPSIFGLVWFLLTGAGTSSCNPPNCVMVNIGKNLKEFWVASKHHKYPTLKLN